MRKRSIILFTAFMLILVIVMLTLLSFKKVYYLNIPNYGDITKITIIKENMKNVLDGKKINEFIKIINFKQRMTKTESISDQPVNSTDEVLVDICVQGDMSYVFYIYKRVGKYYLEQPYNGIYEISKREFNVLSKYIE